MGKTVDHAGTVKEVPSVRRPLDYAWPHVAMVTMDATAEKVRYNGKGLYKYF